MSTEDQELLKAVREWRPPEKLHPIAMTAWEVYDSHGFDLPPDAMGQLRAALDAYGDDLTGLAEACEGMVRFMILLNEHQKDETNGKKVLDLLREYADRFEPFWKKVAEALENEGGSKLDAFKSFSGGAEKKTAAQHGAKAPPGSVPLSSMLNPGRPPPWANKKGPGNK